MGMSDHIKQQVVQDFLPKRYHSPGKRQNWILLFYQRFFCFSSNHIENMLEIQSRGSVAHLLNLLNRSQRFVFSFSQSVLDFFFY